MTRMRRFYGAAPLHLMATIIAFAVIAAGVAGWCQPGSDPRAIILWLLGSAIAFEAVLLPAAWLLDHVAHPSHHHQLAFHPPRRAVAFIRIPAMLSLLLLLVFAPLIFNADPSTFQTTTGIAPPDYLARWLLATAALYTTSAICYALTLRRAEGRQA